MSKIICDICGTSYPETAKQCPICGSVRPGDVQRVTNEVKKDGKGSTGYTQVKGGHFTKSNVKKRTKDTGAKPAAKKSRATDNTGPEKDNRGLVITAIVLLLAVIGVVIYIAIGFFKPYADQTDSTTSASRIICKDIRIEKVDYLLTEAGASELLVAKPEPANTTDTMTFTSKDPTIVSVDAVGKVTAVSEGTTYIDIRCGTIEKTITVKVVYSSAGNNNGTGDEGSGDGNTVEELRFVQYELKLTAKGSISVLYAGNIPKSEITWTSDNTAVATFVDGVVTAVGNGTTNVHAEYNGQKISCAVTCEFGETGGQTGNGGVTEDGGSGVTGTVKVTDGLNIRSGPGSTYDTVGTLGPDARVVILEQKTDATGRNWGRISNGWICMDYVVLD